MQVQKYNQGDQLSQQLQLHGGKSGGTALVLASLAGTGRVGDLLRGSFLFSPPSSLLSSLSPLLSVSPLSCRLLRWTSPNFYHQLTSQAPKGTLLETLLKPDSLKGHFCYQAV